MTLVGELDVLRDAAGRLDRAGLLYMLTGSVALSYYAQPRMTRDIDLVVAMAPADAARVRRAFTPEYYVPDGLQEAVTTDGFFNLIELASAIKVDIVVRKPTPFRLLEFDRRSRVTVGGAPLWIVSREDLMLSKLEWARESRSEVQLRDVRALADAGYDRTYLEHWVEELGLAELWRLANE